jgi:hypothetical protein
MNEPAVNVRKPKKKTKLTPLQKTLLTSEFRRDPMWSSLKVRRMARFLGMRPTQVYKWNWNRKRGKVIEPYQAGLS